MELPESQKNRCLSILDTLQSYAISKMFAQPVDPVRDTFQTTSILLKSQWTLEQFEKS